MSFSARKRHCIIKKIKYALHLIFSICTSTLILYANLFIVKWKSIYTTDLITRNSIRNSSLWRSMFALRPIDLNKLWSASFHLPHCIMSRCLASPISAVQLLSLISFIYKDLLNVPVGINFKKYYFSFHDKTVLLIMRS